ncbi:MAG: cation:proton antiporter [Rhodospirillales bacterium]|nr:cation:proton antiporter [Rhodospirillales bacterium]
MQAHPDVPFLRELLVFLLAAVTVVPVFHRLRVSPVLGYLAVGILIGPHGLGRLVEAYPWLGHGVIADTEQAQALGELGIVFLMFVIGLELSVERLWTMRHAVFGLGLAQVATCAAAIGILAWAWGNSPPAALLLGLCLAMSSTAVVLQLLSERGELNTRLGRATVAILLFQDLAVLPILFLVGVLGGETAGPVWVELGLALGRAILAVGVILVAGRWLLRPLFRRIASLRNQELFVALCLLAAIGTALATGYAGLSTALGAFMAGLVLAETEFRHQIEAEIQSFKGLLVGLFFVAVGMSVDVLVIADQFAMIVLSVLGLFAIKAALITGLAFLFRHPWHTAVPVGLLLGQGGEFGFLIVNLAVGNGAIPGPTGKFVTLTVTLTMVLTPFVAMAARRLGDALRAKRQIEHLDEADPALDTLDGHVVIAGLGRVGGRVAAALEARSIPLLAIDLDPQEVKRARKARRHAFYGDAARPEILRRLGLDRAQALVVTLDDAAVARQLVEQVRREWPDLPVFARARDAAHARSLLALGVQQVVPEAVEASLQLAARVLEGVGVAEAVADHVVGRMRAEELAALQGPERR